VIYFVTVNYYSTLLLTKLIESLPNNNFPHQIIIINNSPDDQSINNLASEKVLIIDAGCNLGFGSACNLGIKWIYAQDKEAIIWLINPDAYFDKNSIIPLNSFFDSYPQISILGTMVRTPTNKIWFAGGRFEASVGSITIDDTFASEDDYATCDWVSGCSLIINLRNFNECPLFDSHYFLYYEDFDFCRRYAEKGHTVAVTKLFTVVHEPSSITNNYVTQKSCHSTYSYLLTLERYTNKFIFIVRLLRLFTNALILMIFKPQVAFGKLRGIHLFWYNHFMERKSIKLNYLSK
jgi:N-acetylglucosaminyl-diphospho-decaprenol L-rhamnosyltransferase